MASLIRSERRPPAAWIVLDRPEKRNALTLPMIDQLSRAIMAAEEDPEVRAIVLTGSPPAFCAGADLKDPRQLADAKDESTKSERPSPPANPFAALLDQLLHTTKPVIAAVGGAAFGGGLGLIAAADIAIASREARFSFSEVHVGLVPAMISVVVVPKIGEHQARRLFLTGRRFSADEARDYGLVHEITTDLETAVAAEVALIARGGPIAVAEAKHLIRQLPEWPREQAFGRAAALLQRLAHGEEGLEGMRAFAEKRSPRWRQ